MIWDIGWIFVLLAEKILSYWLLAIMAKLIVVDRKGLYPRGDWMETNFVDYSVGENLICSILTNYHILNYFITLNHQIRIYQNFIFKIM